MTPKEKKKMQLITHVSCRRLQRTCFGVPPLLEGIHYSNQENLRFLWRIRGSSTDPFNLSRSLQKGHKSSEAPLSTRKPGGTRLGPEMKSIWNTQITIMNLNSRITIETAHRDTRLCTTTKRLCGVNWYCKRLLVRSRVRVGAGRFGPSGRRSHAARTKNV